jgi:hypothetical protein
MWEPRRLTNLRAFMACYRDSFTFYKRNFAMRNFIEPGLVVRVFGILWGGGGGAVTCSEQDSDKLRKTIVIVISRALSPACTRTDRHWRTPNRKNHTPVGAMGAAPRLSRYSSVPPRKCPNGSPAYNWATTVPFHILSSSLFNNFTPF